MEAFTPQDQVHFSGENYRFQKGSSRKVKRALNPNKSPKFLTIINNLK